jgi:hypothetical protein
MAAPKQHNADLVLVVAVFFVYATCALLLCALGANTYRETAATMQSDYNQRTGVLYIAEKVRQNDIGGSVQVQAFNGSDALVLTEQESGLGYQTWIFVADGKLYEEFIAAGDAIDMQAAQTIMPMQSISLTYRDPALLNVELVSSEGVTSSIKLATRSGGGTYNTGEGAAPQVPDVEPPGPAVMTPAPGNGQVGS